MKYLLLFSLMILPGVSSAAAFKKYGFISPAKDRLIFETKDTTYTLKRVPVEVRNRTKLIAVERLLKARPKLGKMQTQLSLLDSDVIKSEKITSPKLTR